MSRDTPDNQYIITNTRPQVGDKTVSQDFTVVTHYCPAIHFDRVIRPLNLLYTLRGTHDGSVFIVIQGNHDIHVK